MSKEQLTTVQDVLAALDQDVRLSSFAIALQDRVLGASIKYNLKYQIYKLEVNGDVVVRAITPDIVVEEYNKYYDAVQDIKRRETK